MTVWEFLQFFPELTSRGSNDVMNNYSIVMDDYSVGANRDEILFQMTLGEISTIIISDNPSVAYTMNGVGGVIELVPRDLKDGISGNAQLDVSRENCILASTNVNYKKEKLKIRSCLRGEFLIFLEKYSRQYFGTTSYNQLNYENTTVGGTELAKFSIEYEASEKDNVAFSIWENYGYKTVRGVEINPTLGLGTRYDTTHISNVGT